MWYLQAGASYLENDYFPLSSDFKATATEDGDRRENSCRKDSKLSFKVGLTPNASDEYALSYYKQDGEKGQPLGEDEGRIVLISIKDVRTGGRHVRWLSQIEVRKVVD